MADFNTYKQRYYVVTAEEETTIVDTETGKTLAVVPAKCQQVIQAIGSKISTSADCIVLPFDKALSLNTVGGQTKSKEVLTAAQTYRLDYANGKTLIDLGGSTYNGYLCYNHTGIKNVTVRGTQNSTSMAYAWYGCNQLDKVTFTDTPDAGQNMAYAFQNCSNLTSLDGLQVDEEGYQVITLSGTPTSIFYNCPKLTGKYRCITPSYFSGNIQTFMCTGEDLPTTGDLDVIAIGTGYPSTGTVVNNFAGNNPNLHNLTFHGIGINSRGTGAFCQNTKNLNAFRFIYAAGNPYVVQFSQRWQVAFVNSGVRTIEADWTAMKDASSVLPYMLARGMVENCKRLRYIKGTCKRGKQLNVVELGYMCNGCSNLTQLCLYINQSATTYGSPTSYLIEGVDAFHGCRLDLPSVQFMASRANTAYAGRGQLTLGISRYKLAYDTSKNDYFEAGEVKYTADDKILYLKADGTETTDPNEAALNDDYITTDPAQGSYGNGGYYAKGALKDALDALTGKGYVLTVEYN